MLAKHIIQPLDTSPCSLHVRYPADTREGQRGGSQLADGFYGLLFALLGDLDYNAKALGLPVWSSSAMPCALCQCSKHGINSWKDCRPTASWLDTVWTPSTWLAWEGRSSNLLFTLPNVSALTVCLDWMHCKLLGTDMYLFGSVFYILCFNILEAAPLENLKMCWQFIKQFFKDNGTQDAFKYINRLTLFVRKSGGHKLRGKAGEIRSLGPALLALWEAKMDFAVLRHRQIRLLLHMSCRLESLIDDNKGRFVFNEADANRFRELAFNMAQLNVQVSQEFAEAGEHKLFVVTSKMHFLLHAAMMARHINPGLVWCFKGESYMRVTQRMVRACCHGLNGPAAVKKQCFRYRHALHRELLGNAL